MLPRLSYFLQSLAILALLGCVLLEVFPVQLTSAALPFLCPSQLAALGVWLASEGRLRDALAVSGAAQAEGGEQVD